jgi:hypothetical protein
MTRAKFHVRAFQPAFDQNQLTSVVSFQGVTDELQDVAKHEGIQGPHCGISLVPDQEVNRQNERHWQSDEMKELIAGMQMSLTIVFQESTHDTDHWKERSRGGGSYSRPIGLEIDRGLRQ